jgi:lipopolysaccharide/colanic/teichoic acid biosynthesis glycosyltransferase
MFSRMARFTKRTLDLLIGSAMIVVAAVPLMVAAIAIKLEDGGCVIFRQERVGRSGTPFDVFKLRTMTVMRSRPAGPDQLYHDDPRITKVGRMFRRLGFDELPQLFNVLAGHMSLVGPRPTLAFQVARYDSFQKRRLEAKPGITSLAVVSGRNALSWEKRIELDVWYIDHWSLWLDSSILLRTLWKVLVTREGLYGEAGFNDTFVPPTAARHDPNGPQDGRRA